MVLDTNILIAYLNGEEIVVKTISGWKKEGRTLFISAITFSEVLSLPQLGSAEVNRIKLFLNSFISIPFTNETGETASLLRRLYRLTIPDAAIAASALINGVPLVTRDKQFAKIKEIIIVKL